MPVFPQINASPFPNPNTVLNLARERINDLISTPVGAPAPVPDTTLAFTQVGGSNLLDVSTVAGSQRCQIIFKAAYDRFRHNLEDLGYRDFIAETQPPIIGLPANTSPDPSAQSYISWTEYFDGQFYWPSPVLPLDFLAPLKCAERISGTFSNFVPMHCGVDGINSGFVRGIYNERWEWRQNTLYLRGAIGPTDLYLRYIRGVPPVSQVGQTPWYYLPIPIVDSEDALAWRVVAEVSSSRGPEFMQDITAMAKEAEEQIFNRQARADQRINVRRKPRSGGSHGSRNFLYGI